jgi:glucan biosynthesis protein C
MQDTDSVAPPGLSAKKSVRLHYLDWLQVLAVLMVFLFHALHPFDFGEWHIKNSELSMAVTVFPVFFVTWGMPFFFLISGVNSWFALKRRDAGQFAIERVKRLLIPYIVGSLVLSPIQLYYEWSHEVQTGLFQGSLLEFVKAAVESSPRLFPLPGYHLWFIRFLFAFSMIALPLFTWLKREGGQRFTRWLAGVCERRGGLLLFIIPLALVRLSLQPIYPDEKGWAEFVYYLVCFISGHLLYSDERFALVIRRDRFIMLAGAIISTLFFLTGFAGGGVVEWLETPGTTGFYVAWSVVAVNSWCWSMFMLYVAMRFLDFSNKWLLYGRPASLPFFLLHQPVIIVIAFYVVQWDTLALLGAGAGILVKLLVVVVGSFVVTLGLYELLIRRIRVMRALLGVKPGRRDTPEVEER